MFPLLEVKKIRRYKAGYEVRDEVMEGGQSRTHIYSAYNPKGHYIGNSKDAYYLCRTRGIAPELSHPDHKVCSIGFCEKEQKWYGWSHRAIYGFGIGSKVVKGDIGYIPSTPQELFDSMTTVDADGFQWLKPENVAMTNTGVRVKTEMYIPINVPDSIKVPAAIAEICNIGVFTADKVKEVVSSILEGKEPDVQEIIFAPAAPEFWTKECGRGEWTALTLDDAKQMAIDFASEIS